MYRHVGPKTRYQMREKLASIGDDSWIEDDGGNKGLQGERQGDAHP